MNGDRYSDMSELASFGLLVNILEGKSGDGDTGCAFPCSDVEDISRGARFIPGKVTLARRAGKKVNFVTDSQNPDEWYWQMPDGTRIQHS